MNQTKKTTQNRRETCFLGWDTPLLPAAAARLAEVWKAGGTGRELASAVCVLPTARGAARLRELLRRESESLGIDARLPQLVTVGRLPEFLYRPTAKVALEFEQTLAWARVLRQAGGHALRPLIPTPPRGDTPAVWLDLAATIRRLHEDLSANRLGFADVARAGETDAETTRWRVLQNLLDDYLRTLDDAGLCDPHTERQRAVRDDRCRCDYSVYLIGTSDLSDALTAMLKAVRAEVVAMVAAPPGEAKRFDEFGSVRADSWLQHHLPLRDNQLISATDVHDQSSAVAEVLAEFGQRYAIDQVTVGVTDPSHVVPVETHLRSCDVETQRHLGWNVSETSIGHLLRLTSAYLSQRTWATLAALVRHSDVHRFVSRTEKDRLRRLDRFVSEHFPVSVDDPLSERAEADFGDVIRLRDDVDQWLDCFGQPERSMGGWSGTIELWLDQTYTTLIAGDSQPRTGKLVWLRPSSSRDRTRRALVQTKGLLRRFVELNSSLDFEVSGGEALELLSHRVADLRIGEESETDRSRLKILGWLDLALDDSPGLVVMGFNHPFVPEATTSDPFLPGTLRTKLRMSDNDRRYARDCYAMHLMITSRPDVRFVVGRRAADASPTPPSRLLAAATDQDVTRRVRMLMGDPVRDVRIVSRWDRGPDVTDIPIPSIGTPQPITTLSVTAFKEYLTCPYRFYLRRILKVGPLDDQAHELAANQFGDLIHDTLEVFGRSEDKNETDPGRIEAALIDRLHEYAGRRYGGHCSAAVRMQIIQAEQRLRFVAAHQALHRAAGWRIVHAEVSVDETTGGRIIVDDRPMGLRGRFDRVDQNERTGQWAVLDYKTHGDKPEKRHLKRIAGRNRWVDLQLPLYRQMLPALEIDDDPADVKLGYFNISDKESETKINIATFTEAEMGEAQSLIHDCVRRIRAGDFAPTPDMVPYDDYPMILQTGIATRMLGSESSEIMEASV